MALPKLFQRIFWRNNTTPAINEDNLNAMSKAIDDIDNRVIELGDDVITVIPQIQAYLDQAEDLVEAMELLSQNPPYIGANGNWYVWDTNTSAFVDSGVDASITVDIADINMIAEGSQPYVTNSGTDTDPVFHLFLPRSPKGDTGNGISNIAKTDTQGLVDTYTITMTDGTTYTFTVTNGQNGSGSGDMTKTVYDSDGTVENAGGIKAWVQSLGYITGLAWRALTGKPFSSIGNGLTVTSDTLAADVRSVTVDSTGTASSSAVSYQRIGVNGSYTEINGTKYMEQTKTLSTSADTTYTFTNAAITADSVIDVRTGRSTGDVQGAKNRFTCSDIYTTTGSCTVTFPKEDSAISLKVRIYIR